MNEQDLMTMIEQKFPRLSKGQKLIGEYILKHYDKAAFMTASKLGNTVGVSESTVVRFAYELGFDGFPELQKALQDLIKNKLTSVQRIELSGDISEENVLKNVLRADMDNIRATLEKINSKTFDDAVEAIFKAKKIYIVGFRSSQALADFLGFYLNLILENVIVISTNGVSDIFEQLFRINSDDMVIGIAFPRYSSYTIESLEYAKRKNAKIVAITDSLLSPLAAYADYTLLAQGNMVSFVDSLVAPLSVINALIVAAGLKEKEKTSETFNMLEKIWSEYNIYTYKNKNTDSEK